MGDGSNWIEIVLLAMLAAFIGLRLVSVLGRRTGQERPIGDSFRPTSPEVTAPAPRVDAPQRQPVNVPAGTDPALGPALQALADADPGFVPDRFLGGAKAAYRMILESFWSGDVRAMDGLVSDEVQDNFAAAIEARDGRRLANKLTAVDSAAITAVDIVGQMAEVTVRIVARIAGDAGEERTADLWTFSRHIGNRDPNWLLIATDEEAEPTA